jgi:hypothetical protein
MAVSGKCFICLIKKTAAIIDFMVQKVKLINNMNNHADSNFISRLNSRFTIGIFTIYFKTHIHSVGFTYFDLISL